MNRIALTLATLAATVALTPAAFAQHMGPVYHGARTGGGPAVHTMHRGPAMHRTVFRSTRIGVAGARVAGPRIGHRVAWGRPYVRHHRPYGLGVAGAAVVGGAAVAGAVVGAATEAAYYGTGGYGYGYGSGYGPAYGYPAGNYGYGANYYPAYTSGNYGYGTAYAYGSSCGYRPVYSYCRPCGGCGSAWGW